MLEWYEYGTVTRTSFMGQGRSGVEAVRVSTAPYGSLVMRGLAIPETTP